MLPFSNIISDLSPFERLAIISGGDVVAFGDHVDKAIEDMKTVKLPTYYFDIFKKTLLDDAKALFSSFFTQDPTPGFGFSSLRQRTWLELEGYFVDKILSSRVQSHVITEILRRLEESITAFGVEADVTKWYYLRNFEITTITNFGPGCGDNFVKCFRDVRIETRFMYRVTERLRIDTEVKLLKEIPLPQFNNPKSKEVVDWEIKDCLKSPELSCVSLKSIPKEEVDDLRIAQTYFYTVFQTRNERMLKILKDAFQKDLQERVLNPNASLTHLATLDSYEKAISRKRKQLYGGAAAVAGVVVFFFCIGAYVLFSRVVLAK